MQRGDTIGSLLARAGVNDADAMQFLRTDPARVRSTSCGRAARSASRSTRTAISSRCSFHTGAGDMLAIERADGGFRAEREPADGRSAHDAALRRDPLVAVRRGRRGGHSRRGDARARRRVRRRHRFLSGPAARRSLHRRIRGALRRRRARRHRPHSRRRIRSTAASTIARVLLARRGRQRAAISPTPAAARAARSCARRWSSRASRPASRWRASIRSCRSGARTRASTTPRRPARRSASRPTVSSPLPAVQNGYGNVIVVRHQGTYSTVYGHLSRFAPELKAGARVRQGETIGYVGMTGWATGPHLHYEFRVADQPRDPDDDRVAHGAPDRTGPDAGLPGGDRFRSRNRWRWRGRCRGGAGRHRINTIARHDDAPRAVCGRDVGHEPRRRRCGARGFRAGGGRAVRAARRHARRLPVRAARRAARAAGVGRRRARSRRARRERARRPVRACACACVPRGAGARRTTSSPPACTDRRCAIARRKAGRCRSTIRRGSPNAPT